MKKIFIQLTFLSLIFTFCRANVKINSINNNTNSGMKIDLYNARNQFEKTVELQPGQSASNLVLLNKGSMLGYLSITPVADGMPYAQPFTYRPTNNNTSVNLQIMMQNGQFTVNETK